MINRCLSRKAALRRILISLMKCTHTLILVSILLHSKTAVYMCTDRITGEKHALKTMPKKYTNNESFQREIVALLRVRECGSSHPNICELKENFDENDNYYLVLDMISGGEMFDHLAQNGPYAESDAAHLVRETASALAFIHGVGLVHGDLKPGE